MSEPDLFIEKFQSMSDLELLKVIAQRSEYKPEAVETAKVEALKRGLIDEDFNYLKINQEQLSELSKACQTIDKFKKSDAKRKKYRPVRIGFYILILAAIGIGIWKFEDIRSSFGSQSQVVATDTVFMKNDTIQIQLISKGKYEMLLDSCKSIAINTESPIEKNGDTLLLPVMMGQNAEFVDVPNGDNSDGERTYNYYGELTELGLYIVEADFYEGRHYYLVDKMSGEKELILGLPMLSPNKKMIFSNVAAIGYGAVGNGFDLWKVGKNNKLKHYFEKSDHADWEITEAAWLTDTSLLLAMNNGNEFYGILTIKKMNK
jgi:hypothetical protein